MNLEEQRKRGNEVAQRLMKKMSKYKSGKSKWVDSESRKDRLVEDHALDTLEAVVDTPEQECQGLVFAPTTKSFEPMEAKEDAEMRSRILNNDHIGFDSDGKPVFDDQSSASDGDDEKTESSKRAKISEWKRTAQDGAEIIIRAGSGDKAGPFKGLPTALSTHKGNTTTYVLAPVYLQEKQPMSINGDLIAPTCFDKVAKRQRAGQANRRPVEWTALWPFGGPSGNRWLGEKSVYADETTRITTANFKNQNSKLLGNRKVKALKVSAKTVEWLKLDADFLKGQNAAGTVVFLSPGDGF